MKSSMKIALLGTVALAMTSTAGPALVANSDGQVQVFHLTTDFGKHAFALMVTDETKLPAMVYLSGDMEQGFVVGGLGEVDGGTILLSEAYMEEGGRVVDLDSSYVEVDGKQFLVLPLVETMVLIATTGMSKTTAMTVNKTTAGVTELRAAKSAVGLTKVTKVQLDKKTIGVWQEGHNMVVAELTKMTSSDYQAKIVGQMSVELAKSMIATADEAEAA